MRLPYYQVDAFTNKIFGGNPACVVPLTEWLPDEVLVRIAAENAVAETAFFIPADKGFHLRWFTPELEMDLCGHATLATAHVLKYHLGYEADEIRFESASGMLSVYVSEDRYTLDFPSRKPVVASLPDIIAEAVSKKPAEVFKARDYMLVYDKEEDVLDIRWNRLLLDQLDLSPGGIIITAPGKEVDFVSRFFVTQSVNFEDPVTGSAHCSLIPFWAGRLGLESLKAVQVSERRGELFCKDAGDRVLISGNARTYSEGYFYLDMPM